VALAPGTRLGSYEVVSLLGAGGMGEVYRARDTKLNRDVALKILPEAFTLDADRIARFRREAQVLASLNHPTIAAIYGFEDSGSTHALVLELVEGPTLADRIAKGPIPLDEALPIAKQLAEALEAAHEQGTIHRDLKPANIKVRNDGTVKVLDFGLAKAMEPAPAISPALTAPPTITTPAMMTGVGMILGTAAYMSPEQVKGRPADKRSDIWAFGCVLYEMLTGRQAFDGATFSEVFAEILKSDPDWRSLPAATPTGVRDLLQRCLQKDRGLRLRDAGDARLEILAALDSHSEPGHLATSGRRLRPLLGLAAVLVAALLGAAGWYLKAPQAAVQPPMQLVVPLPPGDRIQSATAVAVALSPDGSQLAYVAIRGGTPQLFVRAMSSSEARRIPGTEGAFNPFFSPDGQWIGFFAQGRLKTVALTGGAPRGVCEAGLGGGASWGPDDTIIFNASIRSGLSRCSAKGSTTETLTTLDTSKGELAHRYPQILPGGKAVVFTSVRGLGFDESQVELLRLDTGERRVLVRGGRTGRLLSPGYLVYERAGTLLALPFDQARRDVMPAAPLTIADGVLQSGGSVGADYAVSSDGRALIYVPAGPAGSRQLVWVDRQGRIEPLTFAAKSYSQSSLSLSPDGKRAAVGIRSETDEIWIYDLVSGRVTQLTTNGLNPVWSPDGARVVYRRLGNAGHPGGDGVYWQLADGSRREEQLISQPQQPFSLSRSPLVLALIKYGSINTEISMLPLDGDRQTHPFSHNSFDYQRPMFSSDGQWLAYDSNESGRTEVWAQPYPGPAEPQQVSVGGGSNPRWNPNGRELFYRNGDKTMVVDFTTTSGFTKSTTRVLYEGPAGVPRSPNGERFLAIQDTQSDQRLSQIQVLLNWQEELKRRVPVK